MPIPSAMARIALRSFAVASGGEVVLQVVVQLDAVEPGVPGELQALAEGHPVRVGEGPQVDGLLHVVVLRRAPAWVGLVGGGGPLGGDQPDASRGGQEGGATSDLARLAFLGAEA